MYLLALGMVSLVIVGFVLGWAWQRHIYVDYETAIFAGGFDEGYEEGLRLGREEGWGVATRQGRRRC